MPDDDYTEIDATFLFETDKAVLVEVDGEEVWLPKSQIDGDAFPDERGTECTIAFKSWLARKYGWI